MATGIADRRSTWLDRSRTLPRLGQDGWSAVLAAHDGRHAPRPGESAEHVALMSAVAVLQILQLAEEIEWPSLLDARLGPWTAVHVPADLAPRIDQNTRAGLRDAAVDLDVELTGGPGPGPDSTADALVRAALVRMASQWARQVGIPFDDPVAFRGLHVPATPVALLGGSHALESPGDAARLTANGLRYLDPDRWLEPAWGILRAPDQRILFERRGPAGGLELRRWRRMTVATWGIPTRWATAAATPQVRRARARARLQVHGGRFTPAGRTGDVAALTRLLDGARVSPALLRWQPVATEPVRDSEVIVMGLEADEEGRLLLLAAWQGGALAIPVRCVVALDILGQSGSVTLR